MTVVEAIRAIESRWGLKRREYDNYQGYARMRMDTEDLHGLWDSAVNMSEVSNYIDALEFCLEVVRKISLTNEPP